jgi:hypothetical protein
MPICILIHLAIFHQVLSEFGQIYHCESDDPLMNENTIVMDK